MAASGAEPGELGSSRGPHNRILEIIEPSKLFKATSVGAAGCIAGVPLRDGVGPFGQQAH